MAVLGHATSSRLLLPLYLAAAILATLPERLTGAEPEPVEEVKGDLTQVSLEALAEIRITSAAKKQQTLSHVAGAVYVVTAEDIRRLGAMNIPEALRMVPGLHVARIDAGKWVVAARGSSGRFSNKLLVLIDGRSVYTPLFSGVFWEMHDVVMEDIERIEVIRGPGATMWGSNAVNGVINVITKSAATTPGALISTVAGSRGGSMTSVRYGSPIGDGHYRAYAKYHNHASSPDDDLPLEPKDGWQSMRGGFRFEKPLSDRDDISLQGELYSTEGNHRAFTASIESPNEPVSHRSIGGSSGFLLGRWKRSYSDSSEISVQGYYDVTRRYERNVFESSLKTYDLEVQHRLQHGRRAELTWGGGYRSVSLDATPSKVLQTVRPQRRARYLNAFAQEEIQLKPNELYLTIGSKFEENSFGGFSVQPTARALWTPDDSLSVWGSVSRAARSPSFGEQDVRLDIGSTELAGAIAVISLFPSPDFQNEIMTAYEAGLRLTPHPRLSLDVAGFYNHYSDFRNSVFQDILFEGGPSSPHIVIPMQFDNGATSCSRGLEVSAVWRTARWWRLTGSYSALDVHVAPGDNALAEAEFLDLGEAQSPNHQIKAFSNWRLARGLEFDASAAYVGSITAASFPRHGETLPAYVQADLRLGWKANERMRLSFGVQNLFDEERIEFDPESLSVASRVGRNVYGKVVWSF